MTELNEHEQVIRRAIEQFTAKITVPVLYDDPRKGVDQLGTGTLLTIAGRYFLVTADHLFEHRDPGRFSIPKGRINADLHSIGPSQFWQAKTPPGEPEFDIAILELQDEFTLSYVTTAWRVLGLENIGPASPYAGEFVLCGYPSARGWRSEDAVGGGLITMFTQRMPEFPPEAYPPPHPGLDLFFFYGSEAPTLDGKIAPLPPLNGASGASVWEYSEPESGILWAPERVLRAVGVQSSMELERKGQRYFRAKSWAAVLKVLRKADPTLAPLIDAHTTREFGVIFD
jgi:hypothetical protein